MKSGREQLQEWLDRRGVNRREGAALLGIHEVSVGQILNGQRRVGLNAAIRIEERTGISVRSWAKPSKRSAKRGKQGEDIRGGKPSETLDTARR